MPKFRIYSPGFGGDDSRDYEATEYDVRNKGDFVYVVFLDSKMDEPKKLLIPANKIMRIERIDE